MVYPFEKANCDLVPLLVSNQELGRIGLNGEVGVWFLKLSFFGELAKIAFRLARIKHVIILLIGEEINAFSLDDCD